MYYQERPMHAIAALLAAEHLNNLMREANDERRLALVRSARPASPSRFLGLRTRLASAFGRDVKTAASTRPRPARA
jgi:hypothetical protein